MRLLRGRGGETVTYRELYDAFTGRPGVVAGPGGDVSVNVRTAVKGTRRAFEEDDPCFDRIENVPTVGYRWRT